jgi:uncharacterized membrane protein YkvA (DUF1232 family)
MSEHDPFPRERATATLRRMPAYLRLAWALAKDPLLSRARRAAVIGAAGYLASPVDLVPGFIPVIGQLDDIAVALAALRIALAGLSPERRREHLDAVGLRDQDLADDLRTVGATTAWLGRASYRQGRRAATSGARVASNAARTTRDAAAKAGPAARATADRMAPAAQAAADRVAPATNVAKATADRLTPAAHAAADRIAPAARATGRAAKGASQRAAKAGSAALGAAGAAARRMPLPGRTPKVTVSPIEQKLLPPPPPGPTHD